MANEVEYKFFEDDLVVTLKDLYSIDGTINMKEGTCDMVTISGSYSSKGIAWAIGFPSRSSPDGYFIGNSENFRHATDEEIARYKILGGPYTLLTPKFKVGDLLVAESDVSTIEGEHTVEAGSENIVEDVIINKKDVSKSIFWFNNHPGAFYMSDNFTITE